MIVLWAWLNAWLDQNWCRIVGCEKVWIEGAESPILVCRRCTKDASS